MRSIYSWRLSNEITAYITSEIETKPFIYNSETMVRTYPDGDLVSELTEAGITAISQRADVLYDETKYRISFEALYNLLYANGYSWYLDMLDDYSKFYNVDNSACLDSTTLAGCPKLVVKSVTLAPGSDASARITNTYVDADGNYVYEITFGIPTGEKGEQGERGEQGIAGNTGAIGPQGEIGEQGEQGEAGEDGISPIGRFTETIFKRSTDKPSADELNNAQGDTPTSDVNPYYDDPMLNLPSDWSDGIPDGNEPVWMSRKTFVSNWNLQFENNYTWSDPVLAVDSEFVDFEWCDLETRIALTPSKDSPDGEETAEGWHDGPSENAIWMAVRSVEKGVYVESGWTVSKIKGENGSNGTSLTFSDSMSGDSFYEASLNPQGTGGTSISEARVCTSDDTFNEGKSFKSGHLYVWNGERWVDGGNFEGNNAYVHIKYANVTESGSLSDPNCVSLINAYDSHGNASGDCVWLEWTDESGETPNGDYIGIYTDGKEKDSNKFRDYKWSYGKGVDGFGYEYIFCATKENTPPDAPINGNSYRIGNVEHDSAWSWDDSMYQNNFDFIPGEVTVNGVNVEDCILWRDNLISATASYPYVWEVYRKNGGDDNKWTKFIGDNNYAALRSIYAENGESAFVADLTNETIGIAIGNDDVLNSSVTAVTTFILRKGSEVVNLSASTVSITSDDSQFILSTYIFDSGGCVLITFNILSGLTFNAGPKNVTISVTHEDATYEKEFTIVGVPGGIDGVVYSLRLSKDYIKFNKETGVFEDESLSCSAFANGAPIYNLTDATYTIQYAINGGARTVTSNEILLSDYLYGDGTDNTLYSLTFYLRRDGVIVDKEDVPFICDGIDGYGSVVLDLSNEMDGVGLGADDELNSQIEFKTVTTLYSGETPIQIDSVLVSCDDLELSGSSIPVPGMVTYYTSGLGTTEAEIFINFYGTEESGITFDAEGKRFNFSLTIRNDEHDIERTAGYTVVGFVEGVDGTVYKLVPSVNSVVIKNAGNIIPSGVSCDIYFGMEEGAIDDTHKMWYNFDEVQTDISWLNQYNRGNVITVTSAHTSIIFYYSINGIIVDRESVPILCNGKTYRLIPSVDFIIIDKNGNRSISAMSCDVTDVCESGNTYIQIDDGIKTQYTTGASATITGAVSSVTFYYYDGEASDEDSLLLDKVSIPVIRDGNDGVSWCVVELDNEMDCVGVGADGILDTSTTFTTTVKMYLGEEIPISEPVISAYGDSSMSGITYSCSPLVDYKGYTITFTAVTGASFFGADNKRQISISVSGRSDSSLIGTKVYTIIGVAQGEDGVIYHITPSIDCIRKTYDEYGAAHFSPSAITANAYPSGGTIYYTKDKAATDSAVAVRTGGTVYTGSTAVIDVQSSITFYYLSGDTKILDRETVALIIDGKDGKNYKLIPSVTSVHVDKDGVYDVTGVSCTASGICQDPYFYVDMDGEGEESYSTGDTINVSQLNASIYFYYYDGEIDMGGVLLDTVTIPIIKDGADGEVTEEQIRDVLSGMSITGRMLYPAGYWNSATTYTATEGTTPYVGVVSGTGETAKTVYYYLNIPSGTSVNNNPLDGEPWEPIEQFSAVYAEMLVADYGKIGSSVFYGDFMFSQEGTHYSSTSIDDTGVSSSDFEKFLKQRGHETSDMTGDTTVANILKESAFVPRVFINFKTGEMYTNDITIGNSIHMPFYKVENDDIWTPYRFPETDNIYFYESCSILKLPCDIGQNGRRIVMLNANGADPADGEAYTCDLFLENFDCYIYEDGIKKRSLHIENETVELMGYGDKVKEKFYGWVVLNRKQSITNGRYGHEVRFLCYGVYDNYQNKVDQFYSFDGTKRTTSFNEYEQQTGTTDALLCVQRDGSKYKIWLPKRWQSDYGTDIMALVTSASNNVETPAIVSHDIYASSVSYKLIVANTPTNFSFALFSAKDWVSLTKDTGDIECAEVTSISSTATSFSISFHTTDFRISSSGATGSNFLNASAKADRTIEKTYGNTLQETGITEVTEIKNSGEGELYLIANQQGTGATITISKGQIRISANNTHHEIYYDVTVSDDTCSATTQTKTIRITQDLVPGMSATPSHLYMGYGEQERVNIDTSARDWRVSDIEGQGIEATWVDHYTLLIETDDYLQEGYVTLEDDDQNTATVYVSQSNS